MPLLAVLCWAAGHNLWNWFPAAAALGQLTSALPTSCGLQGDGMRSAMLVLLAADAAPAPYPTRSPAIFSTLLRLANNLMDVRLCVCGWWWWWWVAGGGGAACMLRQRDAHYRCAEPPSLPPGLLQHKASVRLLRYAQRWDVPFDRPMWQRCGAWSVWRSRSSGVHADVAFCSCGWGCQCRCSVNRDPLLPPHCCSVLDVCAKAGKAEEVEGLMQEMDEAGLPPDSVAHTILLMAYEKAGRWEAALDAYAAMQRLGLDRNSFTYRCVCVCAFGSQPWMGVCGHAGPV